MTFMISAVIHEMIVVYAVGFFYPVLFLLFTGPGN
jgi:sterol O-acyltransferase